MSLTGDTFDFQQGNVVTSSVQMVDTAATVGNVLTVQADKSIAAAPGGGSQALTDTGWIPIANADVSTLPSTPVEIVATPGANKAIVVVHATLWLEWTADYASVDATGKMYLANGTNQASAELNEASGYANVSGLLVGGDSAVAFLPALAVGPAVDGRLRGWDGGGLFVSDIANKALNLRAPNSPTGDYTGGDPANVLNVKVLYYVADFS